jgi:hypothetical protein
MIEIRKPLPVHLRHRGRAALAAMAVLALVAAGPAGAVLYKWVDANGRVSYSDQPPPGNAKTEVVNVLVAPANPDAVKDMANQAAELKKRDTQQIEDQKKAEKTRVDTVAQRQACAEVRNQIKLYQTDSLVQTVNEKGEPVFMDDTMKVRERQRLEGIVRERCKG